MFTPTRLRPAASGCLRRRLAVLLAVGSAMLAVVAGCGEEGKRKPGGYDFPGAEKDGAGRFKSSQTL